MSQLYVPDGTWTLCSDGKKPVKILVKSQVTVRICGGKPAAVETDRFDGNFICQKMVMAAALIGALIGAAIALTGGAALGGIIAAMAVGSVAGATAGKITSLLPSICSILTCGSQWSLLHDHVRYERKQALLKDATLNCLLGGLITIEMKDLYTALAMAMLADHIYDEGAPLPPSYELCSADELPEGMEDMDDKPWNMDSGLKAQMYTGPNGEHILVFQGTNFTSLADWINNVQQGVGLESEQYKQAVTLARRLEEKGFQIDVVAGHSLGGGLAATAGADLGVPTYTYNAAGVHDATIKRYGIDPANVKNIQAYSGDDDILTTLSDNREAILGRLGKLTYLLGLNGALPRNNGQRMELETDASWFPNPAEGHSMKYLVEALQNEIKLQGKPVDVRALDK